MPSREETNDAGCPLRSQTGQDAVRDFDALIAALPPALRAAFSTERAAQEEELRETLSQYGYNT